MPKTYAQRLDLCQTLMAAGKGLEAYTTPEADLVYVKVPDWILPAPPDSGVAHTWSAYAGDTVLTTFGIS